MRSEILTSESISGIRIGLAWTFRGFPGTDYQEPDYVFIMSGSRSGELDFLKYATIHDTLDSWNPADLYSEEILELGKTDSEFYQALESVLLPEPVTGTVTPGKIRFFGTTQISGAQISLLRLPAGTWRVEFYEADDLVPPYPGMGGQAGISPVLRVDFGPPAELLNNPADMYLGEPPTDRTESVLTLDYKHLLDELWSEKVLAVEFSPAGLGKVESLNMSAGTWMIQDLPERHKEQYYVGRARLKENTDPEASEWIGNGLLIDRLSGVILGTRLQPESSWRNLIESERNLVEKSPWNPGIPYRSGDIVSYVGLQWKSVRDNNIGLDPMLSGSWECISPGYTDVPSGDPGYQVVTLSVTGGGDIEFPGTPGESMVGRVGTSKGYLRLSVKPEPGYVLEGLQSYSFLQGTNVSNLVAEPGGTYLLYIGDTLGYSFNINFVKRRISVVTDFVVPGINYYSYDSMANAWLDYDYTYNSFSINDPVKNIKTLPQSQDLSVSYRILGRSSLPIDSVSYTDEGIGILIPSTGLDVQSGEVLEVCYEGILGVYEVLAVKVNYYRDSKLTSSLTPGVVKSGKNAVIQVPLEEAVAVITVRLRTRQIRVSVVPSGSLEASVSGKVLEYGSTMEFLVYSDHRPVLDLGTVEADKVMVGFASTPDVPEWKITLQGLRTSGKIVVK